MSAPARTPSPSRWLLGIVAVGAMWWVAFEQGERIPLLKWVNLGIHEFGHMLTYSSSDMTNAMAGPIAQVAVPLLFALYFFLRSGDWIAAGVCLAWAGASAVEVSLYVADAPTQRLKLIGNEHDWAFILGSEGYNQLDKSASLAASIRDYANVAIVVGGLLCLFAPLRPARRRHQPEPMVATSRATASSRL